METISTSFGTIEAVRVERFPGGQIKCLVPGARCQLTTPYGTCIPQYEGHEERQRMIPEVSFYPNGALKTLPLQEQTLITTPLGSLPAELVTFYDNGAVKRIFPLNGKLSGFWSQEDEEKLAEKLLIMAPCGPIRAKFISLCFYPYGTLRSLTLWPGQTITVPIPSGKVAARVGVSFHPKGQVASLEPERPFCVETPLGMFHAFDPDAHGIHGDCNSLCFDPTGQVTGLTTIMDQVHITGPDGTRATIRPDTRTSYCNEDMLEPVPMRLMFEDNKVFFQTGPTRITSYPLANHTFELSPMTCMHPNLKMPLDTFTLQQGCALS